MANDPIKRKQMDYETAMAFAGNQFETLHPRNTWPEWLRRCTVSGCTKDLQGRIVVSFYLTPKASKKGFAYFSVAVDQTTAETTVLENMDLRTLSGQEYQGF